MASICSGQARPRLVRARARCSPSEPLGQPKSSRPMSSSGGCAIWCPPAPGCLPASRIPNSLHTEEPMSTKCRQLRRSNMLALAAVGMARLGVLVGRRTPSGSDVGRAGVALDREPSGHQLPPARTPARRPASMTSIRAPRSPSPASRPDLQLERPLQTELSQLVEPSCGDYVCAGPGR